MDSLVIFSKKHGKKCVYFDEQDFNLIIKYTWSLQTGGNRLYAVAWDYDTYEKPRNIKMHRLIMGFPQKRVDHIDKNGLNNRRDNLRTATHAQNMQNADIPKNNTSGFKGICFDKKKKLWVVHIRENGKTKKCGRFKNKYLAALRYNECAIKHYGEFCSLNILTKEEMELSKIVLPREVDKRNNTGYVGVSKYKNKFHAKINYNKQKIRVGYFKTAKEAAIAYNKAVIENGLPITKLNQI